MHLVTYGEALFAAYLRVRNIIFEHEPNLADIKKKFDFVLSTEQHERVILDTKDICCRLPKSGGYDPYKPIRAQIDAARKKFQEVPNDICGLILSVPPGNLAELSKPYILGAMYGDLGWNIPFNTETGSIERGKSELSLSKRPRKNDSLRSEP